jgi:hypothetical protein
VAALTTLWALDGRLGVTGAAGLARVREPAPFLAELAARGTRVAVFDGTPRVPPLPEPH